MINFVSHILRGKYHIASSLIDARVPIAEAQAFRIYDKSNHALRSFDDIFKNTLNGTAAEIGCCAPFNETDVSGLGQLNPKDYNVKDVDSFAWDFEATIFVDGDIDSTKRLRFEVKSLRSSGDLDYFRFNYNNSTARGLDLTSFIKNGIDATDFLILSYPLLDEDTLDYTNIPKYVLDSKAFKQYIKLNTRDSEGSHLVDLNEMIANGHAVHIQ